MNVWEQCVFKLKEALTTHEFNTWILPLQTRIDARCMELFAPNRFVKDWVEQHYEPLIQGICQQMSAGSIDSIRFDIGSLSQQRDEVSAPMRTQHAGHRALRRAQSNLNADFRFNTFVEGKSNQIARAASMQIAQHPGAVYNPLFIYGGVGLGKTHLMQAAGNSVIDSNPQATVMYVHAERFVSEMIKALQHGLMNDFKRRYRSVNALLIDDVQFFGGKEHSQEEFFHTFNALFESKQQIILSSDRVPKEVLGIDERLQSRFGWGLTVAIAPPDLETRVAILHSKAALFKVALPDDVAFFIAKNLCSNVRELEGALRRLVANASFTGMAITLEFAHEALHDMLIAQDKQITIDAIQKAVAGYYKIRVNDLLSDRRTRTITRPRQVAMALAKELTNNSLPEIGKAFGGRDHSTVIHATRKVKALRTQDSVIDEDYRTLSRALTL